jgi:ATP-dependent HslUV protease ATP-binding subunit HslU
LSSLGQDDFIRILQEPQNALIKQYKALLDTEGIELVFTEDAIESIASIAASVNEQTENIGARRLHTVMERLLDELSFDAPDMEATSFKIDATYVKDKLSNISEDQDLSRYIL